MCQSLLGPIAFLLVLSFLLDLGFSAFEGVFGLFALECYGYGPERVGTILVMFGVLFTIMQGILAGPLIRRFGEVFLIKGSLAACGVSFLLMLQAVNFTGVMLTVGFYAISNALLRPSVSSLISKRATSGQGEAMGLNNSFMSLGRIIGPAGAGFLFDSNINLPYICGSFVMFTGFFSGLFWLRRNK
jgi:DHA1 family multidrug resistance protein-like MFS transporter